MKKIFLFIVIAYFFSGCEKKTDWKLQTRPSDFIIVDGIITNERKMHTIMLTYPVTELNAVPQPVKGATVLISTDDSTFVLLEQPLNSGRYQTNNNFSAVIGLNYSLLINCNHNVYTAKTYMVRGFGVNGHEKLYAPNGTDNLFHLRWMAPPFNSPQPAMWEVYLDWSMIPGYTNLNPDSCKARLLFYTLPTLDVSQIFAPEFEKINFPLGTLINLRRYSLNPEHAEFIRSMLSETTWQGGVFSSVPSNVMSNLSEGALGYFGACEVISVTQIVQAGP